MKMTHSSHNQIKWQNVIFYMLFIGIILVLGYFSKVYKFESDWTFSNRNTLTETTQTLLATLDKPLKFVAYVPDDPVLHKELSKLVNKYKRFKADSSIEFVNPDLEPAKAKNAGIEYTGQLALHLGNKHEIIETTDEQTIVTTLQRLNRDSERFVIFLEGHKERDPFSPQSTGMTKLLSALKKQGFKVQPHNLIRTQSIPDNTDILVIAAAQAAVPEGELKIIQTYVKNGGHLLWLQDPDSTDTLTPLADQLGIIIHKGTVVDSNIELQQMLGIQNAAAIPVIDYGRSKITKNIETATLFPFSCMIEEDFDAKSKDEINGEYDAFLSSMPTSWLETGSLTEGDITFDADKDDIQGPIPLAISLKKKINKENDETTEQRIIIVGDSDFMLNSFIGYGSNMDLAMNIFNWLSADDQLVELKSQTARDIQLDISENVLLSFSLFFLVLLPLGLLITGGVIWMRRRKA